MSKKKPSHSTDPPAALFDRVATILEQARGNVVRADETNLQRANGATCSIPCIFRANGATYASLGQRPRKTSHPRKQALKGRSNRCRNH